MTPSLRPVFLILMLVPIMHAYGQRNIFRPEIVGQNPTPLTTTVNQPITIEFQNLVVEDRDPLPVYPEGFTLDVNSGRNYEVDKTTVIPDNDFVGTLRVPVRVNDGRRDSKRFEVEIEVTGSANAVPQITGQKDLHINQGESIDILLSHLYVNDPDNGYPEDFTLNVYNGKDYTRNRNTITPKGNFTGTLAVGVSVNDGQSESETFELQIEVGSAQNVAPIITNQENLETDEEKSIALALSDLDVTDPDNEYPDDFTLIINPGANYTVSGSTITPSKNFNGTLSAEIMVNDGESNSPPYSLQVTVNPVNDPPTITGQEDLRTPQNTPVVISLNDLTVSDPDNEYPDDFSLKISAGKNYTVSGHAIQPDPNFTGVLPVDVIVNDGAADSKSYPVKINVTAPDNVVPKITGQKSISLVQNSSLLILLSHLLVTDPDNKYPIGFSLTVLPGDDYSVEGSTITPLPNFNGNTLSVKVVVSDGTAESEPFDLKIQIIPATSTPIINGQKELTMTEDSSMVITLSHLEVTDTDNPNYPKGFSLKVLPGTKNASYAVSGNTIIPALNFNGFLEVGVTVSDGVNQSGEFKLSILVTPVNDAPEIINLETTPLVYEPGSEPINFTQTVDLIDVDSDHLSMAEIGFRPTNYSAVNDELIINTDSSSIKAIYDPEGILFLVGYAPLEEYKAVIRSLRYHYRMTQDENGNPSEILSGTRTVYLNLHDGQLISDTHERQITMETKVELDIPNAFTPNGDNSNDTWRIHSVNKEQLDKAVIRVYNKRGLLIFESIGFENEWDGMSNGRVLPVDTYYYTIDLNLSFIKQTYKGAVTILH